MKLIKQIIKDVEAENPYKIKGKHETYSQYNEGWSDCCARFEFKIDELMELHKKLINDKFLEKQQILQEKMEQKKRESEL